MKTKEAPLISVSPDLYKVVLLPRVTRLFLVILCRTTEHLFGHFTGDILQISDYSGDFEESRLNEAKEIVLIAAGTGMTIMLSS